MSDINFDFIRRVHHEADAKCNIAIFRDWAIDEDYLLFDDEKTAYDKFINGSQLSKVKKYMDSADEDTYFSLNSFRHQNKKESDLWHLNAFALDFDYYKIAEYKDLSALEMYQNHLKDSLDLEPTAVIDSGRGLYIIYVFKHAPKAMCTTYKSIYKSFLKKYESFGLDYNAMKVTQIIRLPGTLNTKSLTEVEVLELNDTKYVLSDFFSLLPHTRTEVQEYKKKIAVKKKSFVEYTATQLINSNRFKKELVRAILNDFRTLIKLRNESGHFEGYRELMLYIARKRMQFMHASAEEELAVANELNLLFATPLKQKDVEQVCKPYGRNKCPGIEKTMKLLQIDVAEEKYMKVLCSKCIKDTRRNKKKARHPLFNLTEKQMKKLQRQAEVYALKEQLLTNAEIARRLGEDPATITRDLNEIKANPWRWKKAMKELFKEFQEYIKTELFIKQTVYAKQLITRRWLETCKCFLE